MSIFETMVLKIDNLMLFWNKNIHSKINSIKWTMNYYQIAITTTYAQLELYQRAKSSIYVNWGKD